ncbi:uncharacterized protein LOC118181912 [Stegodyphus dumicola]|uniref:uncharacterized protein LOC118181912 n=1 Tax=Stegodyphus dumicola TaxID=202533 RepID=UPI0015AD97B8|nr:uncharacterized protein LOC118181912 [Stegodyphus dumicola]
MIPVTAPPTSITVSTALTETTVPEPCYQLNTQPSQMNALAIRHKLNASAEPRHITQEPYVRNGKITGYPLLWKIFYNEDPTNFPRAAIILCNQQLSPSILQLNRDQVAILLELNNFTVAITSIYSSPTEDLSTAINFLDHLSTALGNKHMLICGDFNAHSVAWGYGDTDPKGRLLEDYMASNNFILFNTPDSHPTFDRIHAKGWPDLTFTTISLVSLLQNWTVREDESLSDHKYITFDLMPNSDIPILVRYNLPGCKIKQFSRKVRTALRPPRRQLHTVNTSEETEIFTNSLLTTLQDICQNTLPTRNSKETSLNPLVDT